MRRAARIDGSHEAIVQALRAVGAGVLSLAQLGRGVPDLLIWHPAAGGYLLLELKDGSKPPSARRLTRDQEDWLAAWPGRVEVVTTVSEALRVIGATA